MERGIPPAFWQSRATVSLARRLLGKVLVRRHPQEGRVEALILETEAYSGVADRASHASRGLSARNSVMFGPGGHWYVYLCYGIHEMLNLVVGPAGFPAAVLIRAVDCAGGPGRLTRHLGIDRTLNGAPAEPVSGLHLEDHGWHAPRTRVLAGPRVGVEYAGPHWAAKPWRFQVRREDLVRR